MNKILKDILIVVVCIGAIMITINLMLGTSSPFYVVVSGSMMPVINVHDMIIVEGNTAIEEVQIGDIIVFFRPSDQDRVIVHRVVSITNDEPRTLRAKGDANSASIPGTDYPITSEEYLGKVVYVVPQMGFITQILKPPTNYIIIIIIIAIMVINHIRKKRKDRHDVNSTIYTSDELVVDTKESEQEYSDETTKYTSDELVVDTKESEQEYSDETTKRPEDK